MSDFPTVTFAGITCKGGNFSLGWGISPSTGSISLPVNARRPNIDRGDLVFSDGARSVTTRDLYVDNAARKESAGSWTISLKDKRWLWRFGTVTGEYNTGDTATGLIKRRKTCRELASLLLEALDVGRYAVSALPLRSYPPVTWEYANPAAELQALCELYGCVVTLRPDGTVVLWQEGKGPCYSGTYWKEHDWGVEYSERPDTVVVRGGRNVYQVEEALEAVGEDVELQADGTEKIVHKPLKDLSYALDAGAADGGLTAQRWMYFTGIKDEKLRTLAERSVLKSFRVRRFLPALGEISETEDVADEAGVVLRRERRKPYVVGEVTRWDGSGYPTQPWGEIKSGFQFDKLTGVVQFQEPQYKRLANGDWALPDLFLVFAFSAGVPEMPLAADKFYRYSATRPGGTGGRVHVEHSEDLVQYFFYDSAAKKALALPGEKKNLDAHARVVAEGILEGRRFEESRASTYSGIAYAETNGAVTSVGWNLSGGVPSTDVRWNTSSPPPRKPSYEEKIALVKAQRGAAKRKRGEGAGGAERTVVTEGRVQPGFGAGGGEGVVYDAFTGLVKSSVDFYFALADMRATTQESPSGTVTHTIHIFDADGIELKQGGLWPYAVELAVGETVEWTDIFLEAPWTYLPPDTQYRWELRVGPGCDGEDVSVLSFFNSLWNVFERG